MMVRGTTLPAIVEKIENGQYDVSQMTNQELREGSRALERYLNQNFSAGRAQEELMEYYESQGNDPYEKMFPSTFKNREKADAVLSRINRELKKLEQK